ncbi:MAG TPA: Glu-tRNA(Gln) amidotransferase subunit GatD [candidate division Zixibacteria bacterium]|nr:Glu-tRNA(Gln) amidotransferase subunit GatD [candidate division Zixibacteria bacterium]
MEDTGYHGKVQEALKKVHANIGDILRISRENEIYEGILIPRSEYSDEKHVVVKLKNGYNIGVEITSETIIEKIGEGAKPTFSPPPLPEQKTELPRVAIVSTGGTIASRVDYRTGGVRPALSASDLYSVVPELAKVARIETQIFLSIFSEDITQQHWSDIAKTVAGKISEGVNGVVIAHGTDTMGFTAAALSFALQDLPVPVILVGAQRSADRPSSDSATNLFGAVLAAAEAPFAEVVVAMHETPSDNSIALHKGTKVRKCHTSRRDAFKSINALPMARIEDQKLTMLTQDYHRRDPSRKLRLRPEFEEQVALIKFYPGFDPAAIDFYVENGYRGIILEGTGLGHVSKRCHIPLKKAIDKKVVVAMTSQCIWGRVNMNVYNAGRDLQALGIIPLEDMLPETALVKLMWVLGQTKDIEEGKKLLRTNVAGELSPRTLPEKIVFKE